MNLDELEFSFNKLNQYVEAEEFKGYDPYDTLNSKIKILKFGKWIPAIAIQVQKRNPVNLRKLLRIKKDFNPKAMGLFLQAYSLMYRINPDPEIKKTMQFLYRWLVDNYSRGYKGYCWGYNFDWVTPKKKIKAFMPTIVVSSIVSKGIFEYYKITKDDQAISVLKSTCDFILEDLPITEKNEGICFSYSPVEKDCCFNASMLGAEILAKVYSLTKEHKLLEYSKKAVDFTLVYQYDDGHWDYSVDLKTGKERKQIDFHQGYILESLHDFMIYTNSTEEKYLKALRTGAEFYRREQFFDDGRSKWRIPIKWPVDIHNQAQGIITFSRLKRLDENYLKFAQTIALWTISNMEDEKGFFYYQQFKFFSNKIPYMRWSQAWMLLALINLLINFGFHS